MPEATQKPGPVDSRNEVIERLESATVARLVPGVELRHLVGERNGARNLFTGLLTIEPAASYRLYVRPVCESLVVVEGECAVEVEDRRYRLSERDAITIAAGRPRRIENLSSTLPASIHVSLPRSSPEQTWVNGRFAALDQKPKSPGKPGSEWLCRNQPGDRFELAARAWFQDLFGEALGRPGTCGGYGIFEAGARLPCHRHEFDESITIIDGTATCIVAGRRHELSDHATALVPQGLCHYFINLTLKPMTMIWVYAGDRPDRIVMDEARCHPESAHPQPK
jgi:quercetin dioxygenase-like cupin family protein